MRRDVPTLTFYGGTGSVTGANFLLATPEKKVLVDCGMFQGRRMCDEGNYDRMPYDVKTIDALLVTHSHMDHIGRIPKLVKDGFTGPIYSTPETREIARVMLADAAQLIAEEAQLCGTHPPYTLTDVEDSFKNWQVESYYTPFTLGDLTVEFFDAGHVLGSAIIVCTHPISGKIVFSGDLGNSPTLLLRDTDTVTDANYMVIESVYGDRVHETEVDRSAHLEHIIEHITETKGTLLIPAFSIERSQLLLYEINNLVEASRISPIPVYLDSPLAIKVTDIYRAANALFNDETREAIKKGDDIFSFKNLSFVVSSRESKTLFNVPGPKVIIAGSGMSHGGRILDHEKLYLSDPKNTLLIVGYQSPGSVGRRLQEGASVVDLKGEHIPVHAHVETMHGFSGHRDVNGLIAFVMPTHRTLKKLFVTMGEPKSSQFFAQRVRDYIGVDAVSPQPGETIPLP